MAETTRNPEARGLPSLNEARAERRSTLRRGKFVLRGQLAPGFWIWTGITLCTILIVYWYMAQSQLEGVKSGVMAKQRAIAHTLNPKVVPHIERIEQWVRELGSGEVQDFVAPGVTLADVQSKTGIYLRLHLPASQEQKTLRKAAEESLHDGFVACLFVRGDKPMPTTGSACKGSVDCQPGEVCNEFSVCVPPPRPFNLRLVYGSLRVLAPTWTDELHEATNDLKVRAFERELERVSKHDVPLAVQMMEKAELFTAVLDESPPAGLPEKLDPYETDEQRAQRVPHDARVGVWELVSGKQLARIRARAHGQFIPVGERNAARVSPSGRSEDQVRNVAAQERQANSCALALAVKAAVTKAAPTP